MGFSIIPEQSDPGKPSSGEVPSQSFSEPTLTDSPPPSPQPPSVGLDDASPISTICLEQFILMTLHCRQQGRVTDSRLWKFEAIGDSDSFRLYFNNRLVTGVLLEKRQAETGPNIPSDRRICPYGCVVGGLFRHIPGTESFPPHAFS